jgi:hypothetical protein
MSNEGDVKHNERAGYQCRPFSSPPKALALGVVGLYLARLLSRHHPRLLLSSLVFFYNEEAQ